PATDTAIATDTDTDTGTDTATAIATDTATATSTAITTDTDNAADNAAAAAGKPHADAGRTPSIVAARGLRVQVYDDAGRCTMRSLRRFPADRVDIAQAELMDGPHQRTVLRERPQRQNGFDSVGDVADAELVRGNFNIMDAVPHAQARLDVVAAQLLDEVPPAFVQLGVVFKMLSALEFDGNPVLPTLKINLHPAVPDTEREPFGPGVAAHIPVVHGEIQDAFQVPLADPPHLTAHLPQLADDHPLDRRRHPGHDDGRTRAFAPELHGPLILDQHPNRAPQRLFGHAHGLD